MYGHKKRMLAAAICAHIFALGLPFMAAAAEADVTAVATGVGTFAQGELNRKDAFTQIADPSAVQSNVVGSYPVIGFPSEYKIAPFSLEFR